MERMLKTHGGQKILTSQRKTLEHAAARNIQIIYCCQALNCKSTAWPRDARTSSPDGTGKGVGRGGMRPDQITLLIFRKGKHHD